MLYFLIAEVSTFYAENICELFTDTDNEQRELGRFSVND